MSQVDILSMDAKIKLTFKEDADKLPEYQEKLLDLQQTLKKETLSARVHRNLKLNITDLEDEISKIISGQQLYFYIAETAHLLEKYKKILQTPVKLSFTGKSSRNNKEKNDDYPINWSYLHNKNGLNSILITKYTINKI